MKAIERHFRAVLLFMLCKVALNFESLDKILNCDNSNESSRAVFPSVLFVIMYKVVPSLSIMVRHE